MRTPKYRVPIPDHPAPRAGFTLLEVLLAVGLFAVLAVTALHSRAVLIRAEQRAHDMHAARICMRSIVALSRAGAPAEAWEGVVPEDWRLTATETPAQALVSGGDTNLVLLWRIWRLEHRDGRVLYEIAMESGAIEGIAHE